MLDSHVYWGVASVALGLLGYAFYFRSMFRGETKPHVFSWGIYALIDVTVFTAQVVKGAGPGSWTVLLGAVFCSIVVLYALWRGSAAPITTLDVVSLIAAITGIGLWVVTSDPLLAVVIASFINVVGTIPTFRKTYIDPGSETLTTWSIDVFRFGGSLFALSSFNLTTSLFPLTLVVTDSSFVAMVLYRRWVLARVKGGR